MPNIEALNVEGFKKAVIRFREAFVIAVGDKSPFAKVALEEIDIAIIKVSQGIPRER